jgi:hypothetical protein
VTVIDLVLPIATVAWGVSAWRPRYIPETVSRTSHTARRDRPFADQDSGPITVRAHVSECLGLRPRNSEIPTYLSGAARQARQSSPLLGMTVMRDNGTDHLHVFALEALEPSLMTSSADGSVSVALNLHMSLWSTNLPPPARWAAARLSTYLASSACQAFGPDPCTVRW